MVDRWSPRASSGLHAVSLAGMRFFPSSHRLAFTLREVRHQLEVDLRTAAFELVFAVHALQSHGLRACVFLAKYAQRAVAGCNNPRTGESQIGRRVLLISGHDAVTEGPQQEWKAPRIRSRPSKAKSCGNAMDSMFLIRYIS